MIELIVIFAVLICVAGIIILINPEYVFAFFGLNIKRIEIHVAAVTVRLIIGILFIAQSDHSRYPMALQILGLLSIVAAVFLAAMGRDRFVKSMSWAVNTFKPFARVGGILALIFGGFIIHAFS